MPQLKEHCYWRPELAFAVATLFVRTPHRKKVKSDLLRVNGLPKMVTQ
jgi:hypothetical protein